MTANAPNPIPNLKEELRARFVGKTLYEVPAPSVVLDLAKLENNCQKMLEATQRRGLSWRAHIKTHKTTELTRLQVGDNLSTPVRLVVSTLLEAENILPLLKEYKSRGREVNVLLGFPLIPSAVSRLAAFASALGPGSLSVLVDHPSQLDAVTALRLITPGQHPPNVFIKVDTSAYRRAGVVRGSTDFYTLVNAVLDADSRGRCVMRGFYSHAGNSYSAPNDMVSAAEYLRRELEGLLLAGLDVRSMASRNGSDTRELVLSVGASPTAMVVQLPIHVQDGELHASAPRVEKTIESLKTARFELEVHAGVYTTLDLQQLATQSIYPPLLTADDIAISVIAEVASVYPGRGPHSTPEYLINAGTLALGREPVQDRRSYDGWGILMPWGPLAGKQPVPGADFPRVHKGWRVQRISQEHGILTWTDTELPEGEDEPGVTDKIMKDLPKLKYGQRVRIWPNHSCIAGACYDWYLIVDSRREGKEDEVVDVWPRWRGW